MTMHGNRGISRQILAAILVFWAGVCAAYEPKVQLNDVAEFTFGRYEDGYAIYYIDEFDPDFDDLADDGKSAMMVEVPFTVDTQACNATYDGGPDSTGRGVILLELRLRKAEDVLDMDSLARTSYIVGLDLWTNEAWIDTIALPEVERQTYTVSYRTRFMEKMPWDELCGRDMSHDFLARLYFSAHNTYLSIKRVGRPFAKVYHSLLSMGPGASIFEAFRSPEVVTDAYMSLPEGAPRAISVPRLYGLYWDRDNTDLMSREKTYSNFLDDLNLHYGAKSYPVKGPMLEAASSAPAAYISIMP